MRHVVITGVGVVSPVRLGVDDRGMDALDTVEFALATEREFTIPIMEDDDGERRTVSGVTGAGRHLNARSCASLRTPRGTSARLPGSRSVCPTRRPTWSRAINLVVLRYGEALRLRPITDETGTFATYLTRFLTTETCSYVRGPPLNAPRPKGVGGVTR